MLNKSIENIPLPARMQKLPVDSRGYPVPWFVAKIDGQWDFRAFGPDKIAGAIHKRLCWLCGQPLGRYMAFVIGPMCSINRVSSEPPSHRECAEYAVKACPFLTQPRMRRNEKDLPEGTMAGNAIMRNPGVMLIWITRSYKVFRAGAGVLFQIGDPREVHWFTEGRPATRDEILAAIEKGLTGDDREPGLRAVAAAEGPEAVGELQAMIKTAMALVPA